MSRVEIFDPAMCCSTGVCGPGVDPELLRVATIISNLQKIGKDIVRHDLADDPDAYIKNKTVNDVLKRTLSTVKVDVQWVQAVLLQLSSN